MSTNEKVARRKLSLLELAKELNNVSKACKLIGYSRQQFYEIWDTHLSVWGVTPPNPTLPPMDEKSGTPTFLYEA